jgi:hypothetical protein
MNNKGKRVGTKAEIRAVKEKEKQLATAVFLAFILIIIALSAYFSYLILYSSSGDDFLPEPTLQFKPIEPNSELKAVIVDQLSLTAPNKEFVQTAASILTKANYTVDYYSGEKVTVNFYKCLPTGKYKLVILRVHSAPLVKDGKEMGTVNIFTSEPYNTSRYVKEQLNGELVIAKYYEGSLEYFGITPTFIKNRMKNAFNNALIIMMGCVGLKYKGTAQAFIEKGAKAYISWNGPVSSSHTDKATINLLQNLLTEKLTIKESISRILEEVGYDPTFFSQLTYYPLEAGDYTIQNIVGS